MTLLTYSWRRCLQGEFLYAAKAFDVLERLDGSPEHWEGKQGACVGVLQMVAAGKETGETLRSVDQPVQHHMVFDHVMHERHCSLLHNRRAGLGLDVSGCSDVRPGMP